MYRAYKLRWVQLLRKKMLKTCNNSKFINFRSNSRCHSIDNKTVNLMILASQQQQLHPSLVLKIWRHLYYKIALNCSNSHSVNYLKGHMMCKSIQYCSILKSNGLVWNLLLKMPRASVNFSLIRPKYLRRLSCKFCKLVFSSIISLVTTNKKFLRSNSRILAISPW